MVMTVYVIGDREQPMVQACLGVLRDEAVEVVDDPAAATVAIAPRLTVKIGAEELAKPEFGTLIFHPSLLPRHRGPDSIKWAFKLGEGYTGATWFWADDGLDTGDICEQEVVAILPDERPREFYDRAIIPVALRLLRYIVKDLARGVVRRRPQQHENATYESWSSPRTAPS
jgi:methionyl-tRNA formyltransferase